MNIQTFFLLYVLSVPLYIALDLLWLGVVAKDLYRVQLQGLLGPVMWFAAVAFYLLFVLGLTFFATYPAATKGTIVTAMVLGGLFGFFTYATYDLTNLATLRSWPMQLSIVDIAWGALAGAAVASAAVFIRHLFL